MKISLNWLKEYIPNWEIDSISSLTEKMVSVGLDIEGIEDEGKLFNKFVIGEVIEKQKHPNADKLSLCKVNTGEKVISVVCGAPNVDAGQKVCVALEGAVVPNGGFEIKRSKIRGEISEGMICSGKELNLSDDHDGILVLNGEAKVGDSFADFMKANDIIFEIGITPNRGDLFSHIGVAREVAALYNKKISIPGIKIKESNNLTTDLIKIKIDNKELCRRFTGRIIMNVKIEESPEWLKRKLKAAGLRPRNNIVDITNYVMFETGQPLHAFDYDKINGKEIIVKNAKEGDKFTTLDSKDRILNSDSLMICDAKGYSGIAGIMGGEFSEITDATKNVFLEVAYFDPVSIRKNSKRLGLQTDASHRFERGVDMDMVDYSSNRAVQLIQEIAGGEVSKGLYDVYPEKFKPIEIGIRTFRANEITGTNLSDDDIIKSLEKIEIKFKEKDKDKLIFQIPEFRRLDITREIDLIEEVARIYGFENIDSMSNFYIDSNRASIFDKKYLDLRSKISNHLTGRGFNEILTNPLGDNEKIKNSDDDMSKVVKLKNSVSGEMNSMRQDLLNGMLRVMSNNFNNSGKDISLKLFETGRIFLDNAKEFYEEDHLILAMSGKKDTELIYGGDKDTDIFDIKGEAEMLLSKLNLENFAFIYYNGKDLTAQSTGISIDNDEIGFIYKIDNVLKSEFGIEPDVYIAGFFLNKLAQKINSKRLYEEVSKYPSVKRDIAIVVSKSIIFDELRKEIIRSGGKLLKKLGLFDVYEDEKIGEGKKSWALRLEFSSHEKTLTDEEINVTMSKIVSELEKKFDAKLRS